MAFWTIAAPRLFPASAPIWAATVSITSLGSMSECAMFLSPQVGEGPAPGTEPVSTYEVCVGNGSLSIPGVIDLNLSIIMVASHDDRVSTPTVPGERWLD